jgi:hypothetical protein
MTKEKPNALDLLVIYNTGRSWRDNNYSISFSVEEETLIRNENPDVLTKKKSTSFKM